jgi:hypothetical protein
VFSFARGKYPICQFWWCWRFSTYHQRWFQKGCD